MAVTTRDGAPASRRRTRRSGRRLLMLIGLVAVAAAAAGGWYFWQHRKLAVVEAPPQPLYVDIKPFVVTVLDDNQATRFVQVGVDLEVTDKHAAERVEQVLPAIQDAIRLKILQTKLSEVTSPRGVETLRTALVAVANQTVDTMLSPPAVRHASATKPAQSAPQTKPEPTTAGQSKPAQPAPPAKPTQPAVAAPPAPVRNVYFTELVVE